MTILQKAATLAVVTFSLTLMGFSTPGHASDLDRTALPASAFTLINTPTPVSVPAPTRSDLVDTAVTAPAIAQPATFSSLADAVAAQDDADANDDLRCLASAIYYESKGEPLAGQLAVAQVIINRAHSGRFPRGVCPVVTQPGQFSFVRGGAIPTIDTSHRSYRTAIAVAKVALAAAWSSDAPDALYFNAASRRPSARVIRVAAIGNHIFYR